MKKVLQKSFVFAAASAVCVSAFASPKCSAPEENWISETYFEAELTAQGYQVESFSVSAGKCYEVKGKDKTGKQVVVYFNPETGEVVEKK